MSDQGGDSFVEIRCEPFDVIHEDAEDDRDLKASLDDRDIFVSFGAVELAEELHQTVSVSAAHIRFDHVVEVIVDPLHGWILDKFLGWS